MGHNPKEDARIVNEYLQKDILRNAKSREKELEEEIEAQRRKLEELELERDSQREAVQTKDYKRILDLSPRKQTIGAPKINDFRSMWKEIDKNRAVRKEIRRLTRKNGWY